MKEMKKEHQKLHVPAFPWLAACDEECWLEEYNRDGSRYNAGRGAHVHLKHAEKARTLVSKIPAMTEALTLKAKAWEEERGIDVLI